MLFALWVVLSGKVDVFHLALGVGSALSISLGTCHLLMLPPVIGQATMHPFQALPWMRFLWYVPWLCWQIVLSSLQVAFVVLHPRMPISPRLVRFRVQLPHTLAKLTLATSITLTPGTITIDVQEDEFLVHALTAQSASSVAEDDATGESMQQRVATLYPGAQQRQTPGVSA
jgi:multicomponent Na+:H+ antiporter subunit E